MKLPTKTLQYLYEEGYLSDRGKDLLIDSLFKESREKANADDTE